jgi:hypothetical protein
VPLINPEKKKERKVLYSKIENNKLRKRGSKV